MIRISIRLSMQSMLQFWDIWDIISKIIEMDVIHVIQQISSLICGASQWMQNRSDLKISWKHLKDSEHWL